jgi:hypothetical protein
MEYQVIPWEMHRPTGQEGFRELTVNFSLWVLHILAGNAHEVDWNYIPLAKEQIITHPGPAVHEETSLEVDDGATALDRTVPNTPDMPSAPESSFRKRPRETEVDLDPIALSFLVDPFLNRQPADPDYLDNDSSAGGEEDDEDEYQEPGDYVLSGVADAAAGPEKSSRQASTSPTVARRKRARQNPITTS